MTGFIILGENVYMLPERYPDFPGRIWRVSAACPRGHLFGRYADESPFQTGQAGGFPPTVSVLWLLNIELIREGVSVLWMKNA